MLILPQQKLSFIVLQETGVFRGHCIGGGWLAMPVKLPDINDHNAWSHHLINHTPLQGLYSPCAGGEMLFIPAKSVHTTFLALHPVLKKYSPVPTLRVQLLNHRGESGLSIVLQDAFLEVPNILN
jgi:hypothetical protein